MNKILVVFSSSNIGGTEKSITNFLMYNNKSSKNFYIIPSCFDNKGDLFYKIYLKKNIQLIHFNNSFINLYKYIKKNNISIVYSFGFRISIYLRIIKILKNDLKIIVGLRWNPIKNNFLNLSFKTFELFFHFLIEKYISNSQIAIETLSKFSNIPKKKFSLVYNGLAEKQIELNKNKKLIITVANFTKRKGYLEYLDVIEYVLSKNKNLKFLLVGKDFMNKKIHNLIKIKNIHKNVEILDFTINIDDLLSNSSIFVLPSLYGEGCPTVILEAFRAKLPVIAYDIDGIRELVDDSINGYLIKPFLYKEMSNRILDLTQDDKLLKRMSQSSRFKFNDKFLLEKMVKNHTNIFKTIFTKFDI